MNIIEVLSTELNQKQEYIENVVRLLDEGNTIPFIARYRKEFPVGIGAGRGENVPPGSAPCSSG